MGAIAAAKSEAFVQFLVEKFPACFKGEINFSCKSKVPEDMHMVIDTVPGYKRPFLYRVPNAYKDEVDKKIQEMLDKGMIQLSSSAYASPITCALKKNGTMRLCGDFRAINRVTVPDEYPLPRIDEIKQTVRGNLFSAIDLKEGFYQIPIRPEYRHKTAMVTPNGLYEYVRMPFGLRNAPPTFQRFMDYVIRGLENTFVYIDDVIVYTDTYEQHELALLRLFERLEEFGLVANKEKSHFFKQSVEYLGFEITPYGYKPLKTVIPRLDKIPVPKNRIQLMQFTGIVNFYRGHVPFLSDKAACLYDLQSSKRRWHWTEEHQRAFEEVRQLCQQRFLLVPLRKGAQLSLYTDASDVAAGGALVQDDGVVEFFSKRFTQTEQRYSTNEREALALVLGVLHFKYVLIGTKFTVYTDHSSLTHWLRKTPVNERHAKWLTKIQDLVFDIQYVPGHKNIWADLLSRPPEVEKSSRQALHKELVAHRDKRLAQIKARQTESSDTDGVFAKQLDRPRKLTKTKEAAPLTKGEQARLNQDRTLARLAGVKQEHLRCNAITPRRIYTKPEMDISINALAALRRPPRGKKNKRRKRLAIPEKDTDADDEDDAGLLTLKRGTTWYHRIIQAQEDEQLLKECGVPDSKLSKVGDLVYTSDEQMQVVLPQPLREEVIRKVHNLGHYGRRRTRNTIAKLYTWRGLTRDVDTFVKACPQCQKNKVSPPAFREHGRLPCTRRFKVVHLDLVGPLDRTKAGKRYILTMMDRFSRWVEAIPLARETAATTLEAFFEQWICRYGTPSIVITDQGAQFESLEFQTLLRICGIEHRRTTAYHPQTNGMIERMHSTLKTMLRCVIDQYHRQWDRALPMVLLAHRTAVNDWGVSPSLVLFGEQVAIPAGLVHRPVNVEDYNVSEFLTNLNKELDWIRKVILMNDETLSDREDIPIPKNPLFDAEKALLRDPIKKGVLNPCYTGPWDVLATEGMTVTLAVGPEKKPMRVNIDRCKKWYSLEPHLRENIPDHQEIKLRDVSTNDLLADTVKTGTPAEQVVAPDEDNGVVLIPAKDQSILLPTEELDEPVGLQNLDWWGQPFTPPNDIQEASDDSSSSSEDSDSSSSDSDGGDRNMVTIEDLDEEEEEANLMVEALTRQLVQGALGMPAEVPDVSHPDNDLYEREIFMRTDEDVEQRAQEVYEFAQNVHHKCKCNKQATRVDEIQAQTLL